MKTLIVDDDISNRVIIKSILKHYGECILAKNGKEAVDLFEQAPTSFDLILLDIVMPIMNGQDALVKIRMIERRFSVPVLNEAFIIMVSSMDDPLHLILTKRYGRCNSYIVKPLNPKNLLNMLKENGLIER